jgi:hypothetical protein
VVSRSAIKIIIIQRLGRGEPRENEGKQKAEGLHERSPATNYVRSMVGI